MKKEYTLCLCGKEVNTKERFCICGIYINHFGNFRKYFQDNKFLRYADDGIGVEVFDNEVFKKILLPEKFKYLMLADEKLIIDTINRYLILK